MSLALFWFIRCRSLGLARCESMTGAEYPASGSEIQFKTAGAKPSGPHGSRTSRARHRPVG
jgi:hypothetical protein